MWGTVWGLNVILICKSSTVGLRTKLQEVFLCAFSHQGIFAFFDVSSTLMTSWTASPRGLFSFPILEGLVQGLFYVTRASAPFSSSTPEIFLPFSTVPVCVLRAIVRCEFRVNPSSVIIDHPSPTQSHHKQKNHEAHNSSNYARLHNGGVCICTILELRSYFFIVAHVVGNHWNDIRTKA